MTVSSFVDRVIFQATATGTGDFVESSAATGYQTVELANGVNGAQYSYAAENVARTEWEVGRGIWTTATKTLTRVPLFTSGGTTAATAFTSAPKVMLTVLGEDLSGLNTSGWLQSTGSPGDTRTQQIDAPAASNENGPDLIGGAGNGDGSGAGGSVDIAGGDGAAGGDANLTGGAGSSADGGAINITGGNGITLGGDILLTCGNATTGTGGNLYFSTGTSASSHAGDLIYLPGSGSGGRNGLVLLNLPSTNPGVAGALWANSKIVTVSTG